MTVVDDSCGSLVHRLGLDVSSNNNRHIRNIILNIICGWMAPHKEFLIVQV